MMKRHTRWRFWHAWKPAGGHACGLDSYTSFFACARPGCTATMSAHSGGSMV